MTRKVDAYSLVKDSYELYGSKVNSFRALPDIRDGLKTVQRRTLLSAQDNKATSKIVKSAVVVSGTTGRYHPHGESSVYDTLVRMVRHQSSPFIPQGNFGLRSYIEAPAAAMRYTGVQLSPLSKSVYLRYRDWAPHFKNELDNDEPEYLPTPIPYCLLNGSLGIGLSVRTHIPPIRSSDLIRAATNILQGKRYNNLKPEPPGRCGWIDIDYDNLYSLNYNGYGTATVGADVKWEYDNSEESEVIAVYDAPEGVSYGRIQAVLERDNLLSDGAVRIRNASTDRTRILISRTKRSRRVSEDSLFDLVKQAMTKKISYSCIVSDNGVAKRMGIRYMMEYAVGLVSESHKANLEDQLKDLEFENKYCKVRSDLASMLMNNMTYNDIARSVVMVKNSVSEDDISRMCRRSLSSLSKSEIDSDDIESKISQIRDRMSDVSASYLKSDFSEIRID